MGPQVAGGGLLVASGEAAALLEPSAAAFHDIALPVQFPIVVDGHLAIAQARNHRFIPLLDNDAAQAWPWGRVHAQQPSDGDWGENIPPPITAAKRRVAAGQPL